MKEKKILVVEDDTASALYLAKVLKKYGTVDVCGSGPEALEFFKIAFEAEQPYDILFIDILLPELDGYHIAKFIRKWEMQHSGDYQPVLIMESSFAYTDEILKAFASGVNLYITKPFHKEQIEGFMSECGFEKIE